MCEKCNCKTSEMIYQEDSKIGCGVEATKKNSIEHSLNVLFDSLNVLEHLDYKISSSDQSEIVSCEKSTFYFESLEVLLNDLPDEIYKVSYYINKLVENINAKLF